MASQQESTIDSPLWLPVGVSPENCALDRDQRKREEKSPKYFYHNQRKGFVFSQLVLTKKPGKDEMFSSVFRIGCGLDRLQWENVSVIIEEVFEATDIKITVYTL